MSNLPLAPSRVSEENHEAQNRSTFTIRNQEIEEMKESTFEGVSGLKIFTRSWQPEKKHAAWLSSSPGLIRTAGNICGLASNSRTRLFPQYEPNRRMHYHAPPNH